MAMDPQPSPVSPATPPAPSRKPWLLIGCGALLLIAITTVIAVAATLWWLKRPIEPVTLNAGEQAALDEKVRVFQEASARTEEAPSPGNPGNPGNPGQPTEGAPATPEPVYLPGSKTIRLTERELNALLNQNTDLGNQVRLELAKDAIHAYLAVPIPPDFPIGGGSTFRARGRFVVKVGDGQVPTAVLEDLTVFGLSLPQAWLGGIKGRNLFEENLDQRKSGPLLEGIKSLKVEPGNLVLEVHE